MLLPDHPASIHLLIPSWKHHKIRPKATNSNNNSNKSGITPEGYLQHHCHVNNGKLSQMYGNHTSYKIIPFTFLPNNYSHVYVKISNFYCVEHCLSSPTLQTGIKTDLRLKSYGIIREIGKEVTKPWKFYIHDAHTRNALGHTRIALLHTRIIPQNPLKCYPISISESLMVATNHPVFDVQSLLVGTPHTPTHTPQ